MTTYEHLVDATLPYGLMPCVVPELKTITIGGAITGLGIESSSYRNGMPHESVIEMDILTGAGEVVTATPDNEHRDLFFGFPNSYGTLGYALRVKIELEDVRPFVHLRHVPFEDFPALVTCLRQVCELGEYDGERVDFIDGCVFSPTESYLTLAGWAELGAVRQRLHVHGHLLQIHSAPARGLVDDSGLPLAVGHRLVLVLSSLPGPEAVGPAAGRPAIAQKRRLLEGHGFRGAPPSQGHARSLARAAAARERHTGRRVAH